MISVIIALFMVSFLFCLFDLRVSIFLYVLFLPLSTILPQQFNLLGLLSYPQVYGFILIYHSWFHYRDKNETVNPFRSKALFIVIVLFAYESYFLIHDISKSSLFIHGNTGLLVPLLREFVHVVSFISLIRVTSNHTKTIENAVYLSVLVVFLSVILSNMLSSLGFKIEETADLVTESRIKGFFNYGDANALGAFYNTVLSFILYKWVQMKKYRLHMGELLVVIAIFFGIGLTGSRMALLVCGMVVVLSITWSRTRSYYPVIIVLVVISTILASNILEYSLGRLAEQGVSQEIGYSGSRTVRWVGFLNFIFSDVRNVLFGYQEAYYAWEGMHFSDPHNFLIKVIYVSGITFFVLILSSLYASARCLARYIGRRSTLTLYLPLLIGMMIISQIGYIDQLILFGMLAVHHSTGTRLNERYQES